MKRLFIKFTVFALFVPALLIMVSGCADESRFNGSKTSDLNSFVMEYSILNSEESADLQLYAGDELKVVIANSSGYVDIKIAAEGQEPAYKGNKQRSAEFVLTVAEDGLYQISVTGYHAKGSVSFIRNAGE